MTLRNALALEMTTLLAWSPAPARPFALGVVVEADRAHVNTTSVTAGATVYDGDRYSTETKGTLLLRAGTSMLELGEASVVRLRNATDRAHGIEAQLDQGTLLFSAASSVDLEIVAREAHVRPSTDGRTVAQISVIGTKELRIYAQRGGLQLSHRGEAETIAEGESYRVILDPSDDDGPKKGPVKAGRQKRNFLLIAITSGAVGTAIGVYESHRHKKVESPDRP